VSDYFNNHGRNVGSFQQLWRAFSGTVARSRSSTFGINGRVFNYPDILHTSSSLSLPHCRVTEFGLTPKSETFGNVTTCSLPPVCRACRSISKMATYSSR
jgi:hypothetical protein